MSATVTECKKKSDWTAPDGKVKPIYLITLSDGVTGDSFNNIPSGTPADQLEITSGQYGNKIKLKQTNGFKGGFQAKRAGNESFSLSYAKDLAVAHIGQGKAFTSKQIIEVAEDFYKWLESKKA